MPEMVLERALEAAAEFTATLNAGAHHGCKMRARQSTLDAIKDGIDNLPKEFGL